ncbi:MAG TPA: acyl transferase [Flavobacteriales bacterium]|nr:acyl transferase [Flavobacteriales bacterium]
MNINSFVEEIFLKHAETSFESLALTLYKYQAEHNIIYKKYLDSLGIDCSQAKTLEEIVFMPIELFKTHKVVTGKDYAEMVFHSSGTSPGAVKSKHYVKSLALYRQSFIRGFELEYGKINEYIVIAVLPSYQENPNCSLIYMVDEMIKLSGDLFSGYYLHNDDKLCDVINSCSKQKKKVLVFGVSYALLDLCDSAIGDFNVENMLVMETGGMKGRRKEILREELHLALMKGFGVKQIHSEYSMTELLSQSYSKGGGLFSSPPWKHILIREVNDPLSYVEDGDSGGINIIDLANVHSCAFIATNDLGKRASDGNFEVLGRLDNSALRGCNLLVTDS